MIEKSASRSLILDGVKHQIFFESQHAKSFNVSQSGLFTRRFLELLHEDREREDARSLRMAATHFEEMAMRPNPTSSDVHTSSPEAGLRRVPRVRRHVCFHPADDHSTGPDHMGWASSGRGVYIYPERLSAFRHPVVLVRNTETRQEHLFCHALAGSRWISLSLGSYHLWIRTQAL